MDTHNLQDVTVSVVMATYNGERYLEPQLKSILEQTVQPNEMVVFDDASSDKTIQILKEFKAKAPFIVHIFVNASRIGYRSNFAQALAAATGDILILADQDDYWLVDKIAKMIDWFARNPSKHVAIHDLEFCDSDLKPIGQRKIERVASYTDPMRGYVTGAATALRRDFLFLCQPFPNIDFLGHDEWIHMCADLIGVKGIIYDVLVNYRRHASSATGSVLLNSARITSRRDFTKGRIKNDTRPTLYTRVIISELRIGWLVLKHNDLLQKGQLGSEDYKNLLLHEKAKAYWMRARYEILSKPKVERILPVLRMFFSGGYNCFTGYRSAIKDILIN